MLQLFGSILRGDIHEHHAWNLISRSTVLQAPVLLLRLLLFCLLMRVSPNVLIPVQNISVLERCWPGAGQVLARCW